MTRDEIIRMARECGLPDWEPVGEKIERFAAIVAEQDTALLRQAWEALRNDDIQQRMKAITALRERLGEKT
jgi:hypothetical protein